MRPLGLLILPLVLMLVPGCSGIPDSNKGEMLALLPYPQQFERTGGFFLADAKVPVKGEEFSNSVTYKFSIIE